MNKVTATQIQWIIWQTQRLEIIKQNKDRSTNIKNQADKNDTKQETKSELESEVDLEMDNNTKLESDIKIESNIEIENDVKGTIDTIDNPNKDVITVAKAM